MSCSSVEGPRPPRCRGPPPPTSAASAPRRRAGCTAGPSGHRRFRAMRIPVGALAERNFRLLFSSTTISGVGDGVSNVALAFAVLQVSNSPVALGLVLAARQVANAGIVLAAGVWTD